MVPVEPWLPLYNSKVLPELGVYYLKVPIIWYPGAIARPVQYVCTHYVAIVKNDN